MGKTRRAAPSSRVAEFMRQMERPRFRPVDLGEDVERDIIELYRLREQGRKVTVRHMVEFAERYSGRRVTRNQLRAVLLKHGIEPDFIV